MDRSAWAGGTSVRSALAILVALYVVVTTLDIIRRTYFALPLFDGSPSSISTMCFLVLLPVSFCPASASVRLGTWAWPRIRARSA